LRDGAQALRFLSVELFKLGRILRMEEDCRQVTAKLPPLISLNSIEESLARNAVIHLIGVANSIRCSWKPCRSHRPDHRR
jgi:hypothetical protein